MAVGNRKERVKAFRRENSAHVLAQQKRYRDKASGSAKSRCWNAARRGCPWAPGQLQLAESWLTYKHCCEVCGKHVCGSNKCLDHCHVTGKLRGVLCRQCNSSIGYAGESSQRLRSLADYLTASDTFDESLVFAA